MSVTFWLPDAKRWMVRTPCDCVTDNRCGYCDDGVMEDWKSDAPDLNFSNANARVVLDLLGMLNNNDDLCGTVDVDQLPAIRRQIIRALNTDLTRYEHGSIDSRGQGTARLIAQAICSEDIRLRLRKLDELICYAQRHNLRVGWG